MPKFSAYSKAIVAIAFAAATAAQTVNIAGGLTFASGLAVLTATLGAIGTYAWPNAPIQETPPATRGDMNG